MAFRRKLCIEGIASNDEIVAALSDFEIEVREDADLVHGTPELLVDCELLLRPDLGVDESRFLCVHVLGHVILHPSCHQTKLDWVVRNRQEHQADVFAFWFLVGDTEPPLPMRHDWEIAEWVTIPVECVRGIRGLLRTRSALRR